MKLFFILANSIGFSNSVELSFQDTICHEFIFTNQKTSRHKILEINTSYILATNCRKGLLKYRLTLEHIEKIDGIPVNDYVVSKQIELKAQNEELRAIIIANERDSIEKIELKPINDALIAIVRDSIEKSDGRLFNDYGTSKQSEVKLPTKDFKGVIIANIRDTVWIAV